MIPNPLSPAKLLSALAISFAPLLAFSAESERPNIIVIMCDDAGFADFGFTGGVAKTPVLDRLAKEGMVFTRAHSNGRCWPTRQSFMTGLNPQLTDDGGPGLGPDSLTLPELLGTAGYANYMVGKWHLGMGKKSNPKDTPLGRGFDEFTGALAGANQPTKDKLIEQAEAFKKQNKTPMMIYEGDDMLEYDEIPDDFYESFSWSDRGAKMIRQTPKDQPLFLFMSYTAPHWPIQPLDEYVAIYDGMFDRDWEEIRHEIHARQIERGVILPNTPLAPLPKDAFTPIAELKGDARQKEIDNVQRYYATITEMDHGIQRLLDALKDTGRDKDTLIVFLSDNGGEPLIGGPHRALLSNTPYVGGKVSQFEGGTATPFIAWWPGKIPAGTINKEHEVRLEDFMATFVELSGAEYPKVFEDRPIFPHQGRSFLPAILDPTHAGGPRIWAWDHDGQLTVWSEPWKAHYTEMRHPIHKKFTDPDLAGWSLFNLADHRIEMNNLAEKNPEKLHEMIRLWQDWARSVNWKPGARWGDPTFPEGLEFEGAARAKNPDPTTYEPAKSPIGKAPSEWKSPN